MKNSSYEFSGNQLLVSDGIMIQEFIYDLKVIKLIYYKLHTYLFARNLLIPVTETQCFILSF